MLRSTNAFDMWETFTAEDRFEPKDGETQGACKMHAWKKIMGGLSFFHAVVQERRKFGPLGWNIKYEFNDTDLETSIKTLKKFIEEQSAVPWDALTYMVGHINYGGRVTDDWDRRCLMSILSKVCTPQVLDQAYKFSESGTYFSPEPSSLDKTVEYVQGLPMNDNPELFGMHSNANIIYENRESTGLLTTILSLQPRSAAGGGGKSPDEAVTDLANDIGNMIPECLSTDDAGPTTFTMTTVGEAEVMDSLATVLSQEMIKFNRLLMRMASSVVELKKAIKGLVVMSSDLDDMYSSFINNTIPPIWMKVSFASLKGLASWMTDLVSRIDFLRLWLHEGQPVAFSLPAFFFPQGFMTGTLQNHARKYQVAIDTLSFKYHILQGTHTDLQEQFDDGVIVYGLYMEGARWDSNMHLVQESRSGEIHTLMPPIHMVPSVNHKPPHNEYQCPVYKTSVRAGILSTTGLSTNFVVAVELPTTADPLHWVLGGTAILLNLDN